MQHIPITIIFLMVALIGPLSLKLQAQEGARWRTAGGALNGGYDAMTFGVTKSSLSGQPEYILRRTKPMPPDDSNRDAETSSVARLRSLIARAEAGSLGYDAVNLQAVYLPPRKPTSLTLGEIERWVRATPGQAHAIGRYQFIPVTLRNLVAIGGYSSNTRFTPALQDRLADILLADAGLHQFRSGLIGRTRFMNNLADIWAGLPTSSGKSAYHGYGGNRATITWSAFAQEMAAIYD